MSKYQHVAHDKGKGDVKKRGVVATVHKRKQGTAGVSSGMLMFLPALTFGTLLVGVIQEAVPLTPGALFQEVDEGTYRHAGDDCRAVCGAGEMSPPPARQKP